MVALMPTIMELHLTEAVKPILTWTATKMPTVEHYYCLGNWTRLKRLVLKETTTEFG